MTHRLEAPCQICSSVRWCGRQCVHAPNCPACGVKLVLSHGQHVCPEFEGYKDDLARRKVEAMDFREQPMMTTEEALENARKAERARQIEHMVDPPRVADDSQPPLIPKAIIDEFEAGPVEKAGVPVTPEQQAENAKRRAGRPKSTTDEERKAQKAEWARKRRAK